MTDDDEKPIDFFLDDNPPFTKKELDAVQLEQKKKYDDACAFTRGFFGAAVSGLEREYVMFVLEALKRGESMEQAIWYAQCEWDL